MLNLLQISTNSYLKRNKSLRMSIPYGEANRIGIIFTTEDKSKHLMVKDFIKKLEIDGKKVEVMCYLPKDKQNYEFLFDFFSEKDTTFWGKITSEVALRFTQKSFDYLFYLDTYPNPLILNLLARSQARCRMGQFWSDRKSYFEFMIENNHGVKGLIEGMYKYTSLLR